MLPFWLLGLVFCLFTLAFKRFRAISIAFLVTFGLLWLSQGRSYYVGPAYAMLLAAGAAGLESWSLTRTTAIRRSIRSAAWIFIFIGTVIGVILVKPVATINSELWKITSDVSGEVVEMVGWQDLTAQVAGIYTEIPDEEKPHTVILAGNYGEAGALDLYGPAYELPPVISGSNSMWGRGYGDFEPKTVIVVGFEYGYAMNYFNSCHFAGMVKNRYDVKNEETTRHTGLYVCRGARKSWDELWQTMQWFQ